MTFVPFRCKSDRQMLWWRGVGHVYGTNGAMDQMLKYLTSWVILMVTVLRLHGMRFVIDTADHEPPHVHVVGDGEARIDIMTLTVMTQGGLADGDVRRAVAVIAENQALFLDVWRRYHG
jgi:hypothetical protein